MSKAQELQKKLQLHKETDFVDLQDDFFDVMNLADETLAEYNEKETENGKLKKELEEADEREPEVIHAPDASPIGRALSQHGMLGDLIIDELREIVTHPNCNQVTFLEGLQEYKRRIQQPKIKKSAAV